MIRRIVASMLAVVLVASVASAQAPPDVEFAKNDAFQRKADADYSKLLADLKYQDNYQRWAMLLERHIQVWQQMSDAENEAVVAYLSHAYEWIELGHDEIVQGDTANLTIGDAWLNLGVQTYTAENWPAALICFQSASPAYFDAVTHYATALNDWLALAEADLNSAYAILMFYS